MWYGESSEQHLSLSTHELHREATVQVSSSNPTIEPIDSGSELCNTAWKGRNPRCQSVPSRFDGRRRVQRCVRCHPVWQSNWPGDFLKVETAVAVAAAAVAVVAVEGARTGTTAAAAQWRSDGAAVVLVAAETSSPRWNEPSIVSWHGRGGRWGRTSVG